MDDNVVVYCGTRNHYAFMETAAKSLLFHTPVDRVFFLIEDDSFPDYIPDIITPMNISGQHIFDTNGPNYKSTWTYMAYIRLAFAKIFPQYDRVLYLDTDTLVLQDISPLLSVDLGSNLFAMVREDVGEIPLEIIHAFAFVPGGILPTQSDTPRPAFPVRPYYNSGVMLMNLAQMRLSGIDDTLITEINTVEHSYPDQDIINIFCHDKILPLPSEYNVIPALFHDFPNDRIRIKHYASDKPLWKSSLWQSYRRIPWDNVIAKQNQLKGVYDNEG